MVNPKIQRGTVVLVDFPYTDGITTKVRPAVIISPNVLLPVMKDVLCVFISSSITDEKYPSDFIIELNNPSFPETGLQFRSMVRTHKIALMEKSFVKKVLGAFDNKLIDELNDHIKIAIGI